MSELLHGDFGYHFLVLVKKNPMYIKLLIKKKKSKDINLHKSGLNIELLSGISSTQGFI